MLRDREAHVEEQEPALEPAPRRAEKTSGAGERDDLVESLGYGHGEQDLPQSGR